MKGCYKGYHPPINKIKCLVWQAHVSSSRRTVSAVHAAFVMGLFRMLGHKPMHVCELASVYLRSARTWEPYTVYTVRHAQTVFKWATWGHAKTTNEQQAWLSSLTEKDSLLSHRLMTWARLANDENFENLELPDELWILLYRGIMEAKRSRKNIARAREDAELCALQKQDRLLNLITELYHPLVPMVEREEYRDRVRTILTQI